VRDASDTAIMHTTCVNRSAQAELIFSPTTQQDRTHHFVFLYEPCHHSRMLLNLAEYSDTRLVQRSLPSRNHILRNTRNSFLKKLTLLLVLELPYGLVHTHKMHPGIKDAQHANHLVVEGLLLRFGNDTSNARNQNCIFALEH
jgi:hypothetical protein